MSRKGRVSYGIITFSFLADGKVIFLYVFLYSFRSFLSYFEKNGLYVSVLSVCIFVALSVRLKVVWVDARNQCVLAPKHDIAALKVKQGHFDTSSLALHNFVVFYYSITLKYLHYSKAEYSDSAV